MMAVLAYTLVSQSFGLIWILAFVLQGFVLQMPALIFHDAFLHRRLGGEPLRWVFSCLLMLPLFICPTAYEAFHLEHHRHLGTDSDTEGYKQGVDTSFKRFALATLPGFLLQRRWPFPDDALSARMETQLKWERRFLLPMAGVWAFALWSFPQTVFWGFVLPIMITFPIAVAMRILLEHSESDTLNNPFHVAIFYRTGFITRSLLFWSGGDCHLIHHLYATIPAYKAGRAADLIRPVLVEYGVIERTSLLSVLKGYFIKNYPHRTLWPKSI